MRVVFDTNTVVFALLFKDGRLSWLRDHWRQSSVIPLVSKATVSGIIMVLSYPKFQLSVKEVEILLAEYLPFTESLTVEPKLDAPQCSDKDDQMFIDLAIEGQAEALVTGDRALLETKTGFKIVRPSAYGAMA